jgi:hypothetical protein
MGRKLGPKTSEKNTILTQRKNVQINVQECPTLIKIQKSHFFKVKNFVTIYAANHYFLKF